MPVTATTGLAYDGVWYEDAVPYYRLAQGYSSGDWQATGETIQVTIQAFGDRKPKTSKSIPGKLENKLLKRKKKDKPAATKQRPTTKQRKNSQQPSDLAAEAYLEEQPVARQALLAKVRGVIVEASHQLLKKKSATVCLLSGKRKT